MRHPTCPTRRPVPAEVLDLLATQLARAHHDQGAPPAVVRARATPDRAVEVAHVPVGDEAHPADVLVGLTLPAAWDASGVVVAGSARHLAPDAVTTSTATCPVTVAVLVGRDGRVAHHIEGTDGPPEGEAPVGRIVDLLLRSVGRPTDPPLVPAAAWWTARWLDGIVSAAALDSGPDPEVIGALPPELHQALTAEPALCTLEGWATLRALAACPPLAAARPRRAVRDELLRWVTRDQAAWMDDGCFARWMLAALPSIDELLALVDVVLAPRAARQVHSVVVPPAAREGAPSGPPGTTWR